jgi:tape measure domain-containing protein
MAESLGVAELQVRLDFGSVFSQLGTFRSQMTSQLRGLETQASRTLASIKQSLKNAFEPSSTALGGITALGTALGGLGLYSIKLAGDLEQTRVAFETMLGPGANVLGFIRDLQRFAAQTPFEFKGLSDAAKQLLAFGFAQEKIIPNLKILGDVSAGLNIPLQDLAYLYGQVRSNARLFSDDLKQFTNRGIPVVAELAKQFGVTEAEVRELVKEGKVGFGDLQKVFVSLTSEGGRFFNLMDKQSQTLLGLFSTLKDNIGQTLTTLGEDIIETFDLKNKLRSAIDFTDTLKRKISDEGIFSALARYKTSFITIAGSITGATLPAVIGLGGQFLKMAGRLAPWIAAGAVAATIAQNLGIAFDDLKYPLALAAQALTGFGQVVSGIFSSIGALTRTLVKTFENFSSGLESVITGLGDTLTAFFAGDFAGAGEAIGKVGEVFKAGFGDFLDSAEGEFDTANSLISEGYQKLQDTISGYVSDDTFASTEQILTNLKDLGSSVSETLGGLGDDGEGAADGLGALGEGAGGAAEGLDALNSELDEFTTKTEKIVQGALLGASFGKPITNSVATLQAERDALRAEISKFVERGVETLSDDEFKRLQNLQARLGTIDGALSDLNAKTKETLDAELDSLTNRTQDFVDNLVFGVEFNDGDLRGAVTTLEDARERLKGQIASFTAKGTNNLTAEEGARLDNLLSRLDYVEGAYQNLSRDLEGLDLIPELVTPGPVKIDLPDIKSEPETIEIEPGSYVLKWDNTEIERQILQFVRDLPTLDELGYNLFGTGQGKSFVDGAKTFFGAATGQANILKTLNTELAKIDQQAGVFGETQQTLSQRSSLLEDAIKQLLELGFTPQSFAVSDLIAKYNILQAKMGDTKGLSEQQKILQTLEENLAEASAQSETFGSSFNLVEAQSKAFEGAIRSLIEQGLKPGDATLDALIGRFRALGAVLTEQEQADAVKKVYDDLDNSLKQIAASSKIAGSGFNDSQATITAYQTALTNLTLLGIDPSNQAFAELLANLTKLKAEAGINPLDLVGKQLGGFNIPGLNREEIAKLIASGVATGFPQGTGDALDHFGVELEDTAESFGDQLKKQLMEAAVQFASEFGKGLASGDVTSSLQSGFDSLLSIGSQAIGSLLPGPLGFLGQLGFNFLGGLLSGSLFGGGRGEDRELSENASSVNRSSTTPAITYSAEANVNIETGLSLESPQLRTMMRDVSLSTSRELLEQLGLIS